MRLSRREVLMAGLGLTAGCAGGFGLSGLFGPQPQQTQLPSSVPLVTALAGGAPDAQHAIELLIEGNRRFATGHPTHPHESQEWRESLTSGQHPYAVILGCSDSRVSPEVVFDEGLGELFVVREAGHVADDDTLGSIEYAVEHLHVPLIVVLGHQSCGAVAAAVGAVLRDEPVEGHILRLVDDIAPAVVETHAESERFLDEAVHANIRQVVRRLRTCGPILRTHEQRGEVRVVGAYYPLQTGIVQWLEV